MIKVSLFKENVKLPEKISDAFIKKILKASAGECRMDKISLTVVFCRNDYIQEINRSFRKKNYPTDVLSFPETEESFPSIKNTFKNLGEIYISTDKAIEQAAEYEIKVRDEIKRLLVHGFLHLAGYDHEKSKADEKKMFKKEEDILNIING